MKTYRVKADDFLLGTRVPRKRAIDLIFAAAVGAGGFISREEIGDCIDAGLPSWQADSGVLLTCERDD